MSVVIPAEAIDAARRASSSHWDILLALAGPESGWNPGALGDYSGGKPTSYGYLQMHTPGGLGDGYTVAQLLDGPTNMRLGASYIEGKLGQGYTLYDAIEPWHTRDAALRLLAQIQSDGITPAGQVVAVPPGLAGVMLPEIPPVTKDNLKWWLLGGLVAVVVLT